MQNALVDTRTLSREAWLNFRKEGIGGSDAACICGLSKCKSSVELWMEKTGQIEPKESGEAAYWGTIMEPIIREEFSKRTNLKVKREPFMLRCLAHKYMTANIDGIVEDPVLGECIFEAKTASQYKQDQWADDNIPEEYILQTQHYLCVTGYPAAYVAVLIGGNQFKYKLIKRDDELIDLLIKLESNFWTCVETNTPPPIDGSEACSKLLDTLYPEGKNKSKIPLPDEAEDLIQLYELSSEEEKQIVSKKEEAANKLKAMLGDNESGEINGKIVNWKSISSERFNTKKFQVDKPEIYSEYIAKSNYRRFSIKVN